MTTSAILALALAALIRGLISTLLARRKERKAERARQAATAYYFPDEFGTGSAVGSQQTLDCTAREIRRS